MNHLKRLAASIYTFLMVLYTYLIWCTLDLSQMDFAGHMASAAQFARSGLHAFNDRMFLGTTHNLFYPPLEDLLINFIKIVSFQNNIISFKIYLTLVLLTYLLVIFLIGLQFKKKLAFIFYHLSSSLSALHRDLFQADC